MSILYAEDDRDDIEILCEALLAIDPKIVCDTVQDGSEVLPYLAKCAKLPQFVFLDINMPRVNGLEALASLKGHPDFKAIPVVMYTTSTLQREKDIAFGFGAVSFINKPNSYAEVVDSLKEIFKKYG
jgi:CheY-like chemotaxis protein